MLTGARPSTTGEKISVNRLEEAVVSRSLVALPMVCLLVLGTSSVVLAQSTSPSFAPPGPPYPEPIDGVSVHDQAGVLRVETIDALKATIDALRNVDGSGGGGPHAGQA